MEELIKKIPISIIAICTVVLTGIISFAVIRGETALDIWGIKVDPRPQGKQMTGRSDFPVGTVIASYLSPKQMEAYGNEWVLANGDEVSTETEFFKGTGKTKLPDLRGMFVRGLNENRSDGKEDPDGSNRQLGDYQNDEFESHNHKFLTAGVWGRSFKGEDGDPRAVFQKEGSTESAPGKDSKETRPKNIALYYYIKIR